MNDVDIIGPWSEQKLDLLSQYLHAYSRIMNKKKSEWLKAYHYIDAFAGSLTPISRDQQAYVDGSPLVALKTMPPFDGYWFIEKKQERIRRLKSIKQEYPDRNVNIFHGDCNEILVSKICPRITYRSFQRAVVFLDPYGLQVKWETVIKLSETKAMDLFINFPIMGVNRLLKKREVPSQSAIEVLTRIFGDDSFLNLYQESRQLTIFGERPMERVTLDAESVSNLYRNRLKTLFKYVSQPKIMRNSTNSPLYALIMASHNERAIKITNDIFGRHAEN